MKVLELFAGSRSIGKVAEELGYEVFSSDINSFDGIDYVTDIWTNNLRSLLNPMGWQPRQECFNGNKNCHYESAPRGSKTGTQGIKGNYERSKIPYELCKEILNSTNGNN